MGANEFLLRLSRLDRKVVQGAVMVTIIALILIPLPLPLEISEGTKAFYNGIDSLEEGNIVVIVCSHGAHEFAELQGGYEAVSTHLLRKNCKIMWVTPLAPLADLAMFRVLKEFPEKTYGEDWVNLGLLPGGEVGMASFLKDIHATIPRDFRGTPLENVPMMKDVKSAEDIDCVVPLYSSDISALIRQYWAPYKLTIYAVWAKGVVPQNIGFWPEAVPAFLNGVDGEAQYELMINKPGLATKFLAILSLEGIVFIIFLILANIGELGERGELTKKIEEVN
ncbi:MAG: hypothetical protein HWN66_11725 [Candidatus Helarchaeota archaeon]|nr:hypothetical protein [Candidatus Helarchaeota archaeon]